MKGGEVMGLFTLNPTGRQPIYEQLYQSVVKMAALGVFVENDQLPSVRSVAQELGVNVNTVQKAYQMLERDGVIISYPGKGSFIAPGDTAIQRRQKTAREALLIAAQEAAECGLSEEEIVDCAREGAKQKKTGHGV